MKNNQEYLSTMAIIRRKPKNRERDIWEWATRLERAEVIGQWGMASKARFVLERLQKGGVE